MEHGELSDILRDLPVLVALHETGSVTAAADELAIPQPSASRTLARLSQRTGVVLTKRAGRGLALTEAGARLAVVAAESLSRIEDALAAEHRIAAAENALITVSYQTLLGESFIPRAVARYRARYPTVRLKLLHGSRDSCIEAAQQHSSDLALVADCQPLSGLQETRLYEEPLIAAVSPDHPLANHQGPVTPAQLLEHDLVVLGPGYGLYGSVMRIFGWEALPETAIEVDDSRIARGLAAAGAGISILPAGETSATGPTVELRIDSPEARRSISALVPGTPGPAILGLLEALEATARSRRRARTEA